MKYLLDAFVYVLSIALCLLLLSSADAAPKPYTVKSHNVSEDPQYMYYSDTLSDGSEKTRKVAKPKPREYPASVTLVATNDFPVQVQYVYVEMYPTGRITTNYQYRTKSAHERAVINLPPMPELVPPMPGKADPMGQVIKRRKEPGKNDHGWDEFMIIDKKTMARADRIIRRTLVDGKIQNLHQSGKVTTFELKRAFTARVKSAPVETDVKITLHPCGLVNPDSTVNGNFSKKIDPSPANGNGKNPIKKDIADGGASKTKGQPNK